MWWVVLTINQHTLVLCSVGTAPACTPNTRSFCGTNPSGKLRRSTKYSFGVRGPKPPPPGCWNCRSSQYPCTVEQRHSCFRFVDKRNIQSEHVCFYPSRMGQWLFLHRANAVACKLVPINKVKREQSSKKKTSLFSLQRFSVEDCPSKWKLLSVRCCVGSAAWTRRASVPDSVLVLHSDLPGQTSRIQTLFWTRSTTYVRRSVQPFCVSDNPHKAVSGCLKVSNCPRMETKGQKRWIRFLDFVIVLSFQ